MRPCEGFRGKRAGGFLGPAAELRAGGPARPQAYITNFGEEVVRGQPLSVLSQLLRWVAPELREAAGVSSWQASPVPARHGIHCRCECMKPSVFTVDV